MLLNRVEKVFMRISTLVTGILLVLALMVAAPIPFGVSVYTVMSGSMLPTLPIGSCVYLNHRDKEPEVGDIIIYKYTEDFFIVHRVIELETDGTYILKGDANPVTDPAPVKPEQVLGTYMFYIPYLGYFITFLREGGWIALGAVIFVLNLGPALLRRALGVQTPQEAGTPGEKESGQEPADEKPEDTGAESKPKEQEPIES